MIGTIFAVLSKAIEHGLACRGIGAVRGMIGEVEASSRERSRRNLVELDHLLVRRGGNGQWHDTS